MKYVGPSGVHRNCVKGFSPIFNICRESGDAVYGPIWHFFPNLTKIGFSNEKMRSKIPTTEPNLPFEKHCVVFDPKNSKSIFVVPPTPSFWALKLGKIRFISIFEGEILDFGSKGQKLILMRWKRYSDCNKKSLMWVLEFWLICGNGPTKSDLMKNVLTLTVKFSSQQRSLRKVKMDMISPIVVFQEAFNTFLEKWSEMGFFSLPLSLFFGFWAKYRLLKKMNCMKLQYRYTINRYQIYNFLRDFSTRNGKNNFLAVFGPFLQKWLNFREKVKIKI